MSTVVVKSADVVAMDLECERIQNAIWQVTATKGGNPIDLTGATVVMAARRNQASDILFELTTGEAGGITLANDPTTGVATVKLRPEDTADLSNEVTDLVYSIHVVTADGDKWKIAEGTLTVKPTAWDGT